MLDYIQHVFYFQASINVSKMWADIFENYLLPVIVVQHVMRPWMQTLDEHSKWGIKYAVLCKYLAPNVQYPSALTVIIFLIIFLFRL